MNNDDKIDKVCDDVNDVKLTLARIEVCLHSTPCQALTEFKTKHSDQVSALHIKIDDKFEKHMDDHHSNKSQNSRWTTVGTMLSPLIAAAALVYMMMKG